jgi:soluble lytic murein transglycosylase
MPLFIVILLLLLPSATLANPQTDTHARNAMLFADRRDWREARLHAARSDESALIKLIAWQYMLDPDSGASFDEITRFTETNPDWPEQKRLRLRAEMALRDGATPDSDVIAWFGENVPVSGIGKIALAEALARLHHGSQEKITSLIREGWRGGDFEEAQEKNILASHGSLLRQEDHIERTDRLLWEEKTGPVKRMLPRLPEARQKLAKARIALIDDKKTSTLSVAQVPASLKEDPGLIYDRMRYRARRSDSKGVREMLLSVRGPVPYPEKWWRWREQQVREAIDEGNFTQAGKLLEEHGLEDGQALADATWLKGWLELEFRKQPKAAYETFYQMHSQVRFPVSKSRAAFWAARAAERAGDQESATNWYNSASAYPTTFYGQLASLKRHGTAPLHIPATPQPGDGARREFESRELVRAVKLCVQLGETELASRLITHLIENTKDTQEAALAAGLGHTLGHPFLSVRGAKRALQQHGEALLDIGYPAPPTPGDIDIERPLALSIIRQESEFDPGARSRSNARGMMQLLLATAKEIARKKSIGFHHDRLYDAQYNIVLGSHYLSRLIDNYGGSYVMAIAAYNAGPGNVRKWVTQFGTPGNDMDSAINWIEKIPFSETRNYVQRVIENLQVYRHIEARGAAPTLAIGEDLVR